jgi:hypothetical protein
LTLPGLEPRPLSRPARSSPVGSFIIIIIIIIIISGVRQTETLGTAATIGLLYQPLMIGDGDCGEIGGKKIGKGKPAPAPLSPPQILPD